MKKSFSLVEVLVFISVLGLFFTAALSVTTFNLQNMKIQEHKILATRFTEEGIEWVKQEKEDNWTLFLDHNVGYYCLNSLGWTSNSISSPACAEANYISGTIFKRELSLTKPVADQVNMTVTVTWQEGGNSKNVQIKSVFKLLE